VGTNTSLPVSDSHGNPVPIQLAFDRLLMPVTVNRQTIYLYQAGAKQVTITPSIAYDPVARVVSVTPLSPLTQGQSYTLQIASPKSYTDPSGLHAIDGATLDPNSASSVTFTVGPALTTAYAAPPSVDFCADVQPTFGACIQTGCHGNGTGPTAPAEGLLLGPGGPVLFGGLNNTAIGRASQEVNTGPLPLPQAASIHFPDGMAIIDPGTDGAGDPGNSYIVYKLLLGAAAPPATGAGPTQLYSGVTWSPISDAERAALASLIPGVAMPYPVEQGQPSELTADQMEQLSLWIAQGAVPISCP